MATGGPPSPSPTSLLDAPVAERRLVSLLFADLVGFATLAEGRDAEDTRELLTRYFDLARTVIERYGGTVEKFIGDAVMALWGAPTAFEDDAERAVRAALDLVDSVRSLGPDVQARAGVLTGEAAVTIGAVGQGMVAGDNVNTASRLQSVAAPGTVLVNDATERAASRAIVFEPAGEQALKGKAAPVPAWRAMRVIAEVGGRGRSDVLEAPFVGRDDDLRLLKELFHATTRERRARLVSVTGPAGIGKTRLAWELLKYIDGLVETVWYHDGRSPAYGDGISFWALGEMVRLRAQLAETDDEATTRTKIAATLDEYVPDEAERRWIEPALLTLLGIQAGSVASQELFAAWRTFFERMAETSPVVMVFEDFHFADDGLIDFVDHLLEWSRSYPIYVVTLSRPELLDRRPDWGAGKRSFTSIFLEPLSTEAMNQLLAGLVPGLPDSAARAIVERADGIPLYAVETVRMLLAEGRLTTEDGVYRPTGDLSSLAIPETLTALIASRLDALPPDERALVSDAAVTGQSFSPAALAAVSGLEHDVLEARLRTLVAREILTVQTDARSPERGQYAFVQALIREVAYNALAKRDRRSRHVAAARFFESLGTDEIAGALAGHYLAAYRNSPEGPEADAMAAQARIALGAAAERAITLGSYEQSLTFLEQALTVTTDPAERAGLLERAGEAALAAGHYEAAETHFREALEVRSSGDQPPIARVTAALGRTLLYARRTPDAIALLEPAAAELDDLAGRPEGSALLGQLARAYFFAGDNRRAIEMADRVLETAEHLDLPDILADTLVTRGTALANIGRPVEGKGALLVARDYAESRGLSATVLRAMNNRGVIDQLSDQVGGMTVMKEGLALARRIGARGWVPGFARNLAGYAVRVGEFDLAVRELRAALADEYEPIDRAELLCAIAEIEVLRGLPVDDVLAEAGRILGDSDDPQTRQQLLGAHAWVAFANGDLAGCRRDVRAMVAIAEGADAVVLPDAARAALWMGDVAGAREDLGAIDASGVHGAVVEASRVAIRAGIAALEGRTAEAMALFRDALRRWRDLGLAWDVALTGLDMAILLDPADPEVLAAAGASRDILERLGAAPFIARLDEAMSRAGGGAAAPSGRAPDNDGTDAPRIEVADAT